MLEELVNVVILGLIQGLAEWLPISSTAHLRIAEQFLGLTTTPLFSVTLHAGTLVVVVLYFRQDIRKVLSALVRLDFKSEYGQIIPRIIVATIPTAIIGVFYVVFLENSFQTFLTMGIAFLIGATVLYLSRTGKEHGDKVATKFALLMGTAQGFAVFPGLSRSGITISTALLLGLQRKKAFEFSFLLSIPAIAGDLIVEAYVQKGQFAFQTIGLLEILVGLIVAMIAGYAAIRIVSRLVMSKRFHYFALYTWVLGAVLVALAVFGF